MIAEVDREGKGVIEYGDFLELMTVKMVINWFYYNRRKETPEKKWWKRSDYSMMTAQGKSASITWNEWLEN
jgi:hypothetical protein